MKIGVLGSGPVGRVLGKAFLTEGHEVMLGTRNLSKDEVLIWKKENPSGRAGSFEDTARFGEMIVLATAGLVIEDVIRQAGTDNFSGKVVIDTTNPIAASPPDNGVLKFFTTLEESLMEIIQKQIPEAKLVKAFNSIGNAFMYKPLLPGGPPTMFICGNDAEAKNIVTSVLTDFGFE